MTPTQNMLLAEYRSVMDQLMDLVPAHPWVPGLHRRIDGIVKDLHRTGMPNEQIDLAI